MSRKITRQILFQPCRRPGNSRVLAVDVLMPSAHFLSSRAGLAPYGIVSGDTVLSDDVRLKTQAEITPVIERVWRKVVASHSRNTHGPE